MPLHFERREKFDSGHKEKAEKLTRQIKIRNYCLWFVRIVVQVPWIWDAIAQNNGHFAEFRWIILFSFTSIFYLAMLVVMICGAIAIYRWQEE